MQPPETTRKSLGLKNRRFVFTVMAGILLLVGAIIILMTVFKDDSKNTATTVSGKPKFENQLTPTTELKVGTHRYVSPCQAFPMSAAITIFSSATVSTRVTEDSLAVSIPTSDADYIGRTTCEYNLQKGTVTLDADQYVDASELKRVSTAFVGSADKIKSNVDALRKQAAGNGDAEAFVRKLDASLTKYNKYAAEFDEDKLAKVNFDGMVLPDFLGDIRMIQGNVLYWIDPHKSLDNLTADDIGNLGQAFSVVAKNARNPHLDQSPVNTILGNSDNVGSTKILEPCVVLDGATFKKITGVPENDLMTRLTLPVDANRDVIDKQVNKRVIFFNYCARTNSGDPTDTEVDLQLSHAKTTAYAKQYVKDFNDDPAAAAPEVLQTSADEAYIFHSSQDPKSNTYLFRVGSYVGVVEISTSTKTSGDTAISDGSRNQHVAAINTLVGRIKSQL